MDFISRLSPTLWDLLQRMRLRSDLAFEVFDDTLTALFAATDDPRIGILRNTATIGCVAQSDLSFLTVLQSGREARLSVEQWEVILLPVHDNAQPIGLLAAVAPREPAGEWAGAGPGETVARALRDAIEGDLVAARRLGAQEHAANRSRAVAGLVADLQQFSQESQLLNALLQAIAAWHDVEACAYVRDLAGKFTLRATLPGSDVSALPASLDAGAVIEAATDRLGQSQVLSRFAWRDGGTPLPIVVNSGSLDEWLIALIGARDTDIVAQLNPLLRGFAAGLERVREREAAQLRQLLLDAMTRRQDSEDVPGLARELLGIMCGAVHALQGVFAVVNEAGSGSATAATAMMRPDPSAQIVRDGYFSADALSVRYPLVEGRVGSMDLCRGERGAFRSADVATVLAARPLLAAWLSGQRGRDEWQAGFAAPDQAKVLRFGDSTRSAYT